MAVPVIGKKHEILIIEAEIASRINKLSEQINKTYERTNSRSFVDLCLTLRWLGIMIE